MHSLSTPWLRAVVANIQEAIVVLDGQGRIIYENESAAEMLGIAGRGAEPAFRLDRVHPEERDDVIRSFERTIASPGAVFRGTYRFRRSDGSWRHLEALAKNLLHDPDLAGVLITFRDVSDRIAAVDEARRAGQAHDEFLSRMTHELRTPLHAILGWAQILEMDGGRSAPEAARQIEDAGRHLLRLVEEGIDLAAVREGRIALQMAPVEVEEIARGAAELLTPLATARAVALRPPSGPEGVRVLADARRLRQILVNLLGNAIKFDRGGGEVGVHWRLSGSTCRITISDSGPGIPAERLGDLFERYARLPESAGDRGGSGLGLAISRQLAERMSGRMGVESRPGIGSAFWIELPLAPDDAAPLPPVVRPVGQP